MLSMIPVGHATTAEPVGDFPKWARLSFCALKENLNTVNILNVAGVESGTGFEETAFPSSHCGEFFGMKLIFYFWNGGTRTLWQFMLPSSLTSSLLVVCLPECLYLVLCSLTLASVSLLLSLSFNLSISLFLSFIID